MSRLERYFRRAHALSHVALRQRVAEAALERRVSMAVAAGCLSSVR